MAVAIANKNVIQGMTPDEVKQSVGQPETGVLRDRSERLGADLDLHDLSRGPAVRVHARCLSAGPCLQTYYVKVPIGQLIVAFANGVVISVEQHKTDPNSPGVVTN